MKTSDFFYNLPEHLISQNPHEKRDDSRLLVYNRSTLKVEHKVFSDILQYFKAGDVLVVNNTRVLPAKLLGVINNSKQIEVLLHKRLHGDDWEILVKNAKRYKEGDVVVFGDNLAGVFLKDRHNDNRVLRLQYKGIFEEVLSIVGKMPLPHYIKPDLKDNARYQTVYAKDEGESVAAPTAGLHFIQELIDELKLKGVEWITLTLNVGLGTFRPVKSELIEQHKMHSEEYQLTKEAADAINVARSQGRRIIAVGTTTVRVLESACNEIGELLPQTGHTQIFIYPPYKFKIVDALITNFHLPQSTLIMLVSAFAGRKETLGLYDLAVQKEYSFFSFGDCMLIL